MNTMQTMAQLEQMRQNYNLYNGIAFVGYIGGAVGVGILSEVTSGGAAPLLMLIGIGAFAIAVWLTAKANSIRKQFRHMYKNAFLVGILGEYFTDLYCDWDKGFSEQYVSDIGLTQWGNRFKSEDYMKGMYKGVAFEQSDVTVKHVVRSGKHTHTYTYFKGRMFSFTCPKTDYMSTVLFSRSFDYKGRGGKFNYEKVKMESIDFNNEFKIKAVNPHDAFYILTPQLMECIRNLYYKYGNVAMHYYYGKLYLAINMSSDAFDADMSKPIVYAEEVEKMRWDIGVICDIIDTLSLYPIRQVNTQQHNNPQQVNQMQYNNQQQYNQYQQNGYQQYPNQYQQGYQMPYNNQYPNPNQQPYNTGY